MVRQGVTIGRHGQIRASIVRFIVRKAEIVVLYILQLLGFNFSYNSIHIEFTYGRCIVDHWLRPILIFVNVFWHVSFLRANRGAYVRTQN
jgi:hypothetical protein